MDINPGLSPNANGSPATPGTKFQGPLMAGGVLQSDGSGNLASLGGGVGSANVGYAVMAQSMPVTQAAGGTGDIVIPAQSQILRISLLVTTAWNGAGRHHAGNRRHADRQLEKHRNHRPAGDDHRDQHGRGRRRSDGRIRPGHQQRLTGSARMADNRPVAGKMRHTALVRAQAGMVPPRPIPNGRLAKPSHCDDPSQAKADNMALTRQHLNAKHKGKV